MRDIKNTKEIAQVAKEKGFIAKTITTSFTNKYLLGGKNVFITDTCIYLWLTELQKWLRESHEIYCEVMVVNDENNETKFIADIVSDIIEEEVEDNTTFETYEEGLEDAVREALNLIK